MCNLASVALSKMVGEKDMDYAKIEQVVRMLVRNLNKVIDINVYPTKEGETSNKRHRPIGIGVQGLADAFAMLHVPFESERAQEINLSIFETMYYAAVDESCRLAQERGPYETFAGSPASRGEL